MDQSGNIVIGAAVALTNDRTGDVRTSASNGVGVFTLPAVPPGQYSVKVEHAGFKAYERKGKNLTANEVLSLGEMQLSVGAVTETASVVAQGSVVSVNSSERSALLTSNQTEMLQMKGRDPVSLLALGFAFAALFWAVVQPWWSFPTEYMDDRVSLDGALFSATLPVWALLVSVVLVGTIVPFLLLLGALRHLSATRTGVTAMFEPVAGALVAYALLGESLTGPQLVGGGIVLAGILLAQTAR